MSGAPRLSRDEAPPHYWHLKCLDTRLLECPNTDTGLDFLPLTSCKCRCGRESAPVSVVQRIPVTDGQPQPDRRRKSLYEAIAVQSTL
jgi:hypothetical protein